MEIHEKTKMLHREIYEKCLAIFADSEVMSPGDGADMVAHLKKCVELLEDARKEINKVVARQSKVLCMQWLLGGGKGPIRGKIATASPRIRSSVTPPKKDEKQFNGALDLALDYDSEKVLRYCFPLLRKVINEANKKGEPLPDCLKDLKMFDEYNVTIRWRVNK